MNQAVRKQSKPILENQSDVHQQSKNILLLTEDLEYNILKDSLEKIGYRVFKISENAKGLEVALHSFAIDVVLIPINDTTSFRSLKIGKFLHHLEKVPFIYLSTSCQDSLMFKAQKTYPYGYHVYPIDTINLYASIECASHCFKKNQLYNSSVRRLQNEYYELKKQAFNIHSKKTKVKLCDCYAFRIKGYSLLYQNQEIKMTKHEKRLVTLLVAQLGSIVEFERIIDYVWGSDIRIEYGGGYATNNDVRTLVWRLNKKLPAPLIQNSMGQGYLIEFRPFQKN